MNQNNDSQNKSELTDEKPNVAEKKPFDLDSFLRSGMTLASDPDYGILEKSDIDKYASILPPEKQAEGRRLLEKEYDKQQAKRNFDTLL